MINNEMQSVKVITFSAGVDDYGQTRQTVSSFRYVNMAVKLYSQNNASDPRFLNVEYVGLTADHTITTANQIEIGSKKYNIERTIPSGRYLQVLLKNAD